MEFSFEQSQWELYLNSIPENGSITAMQMLTILEDENEEAVGVCPFHSFEFAKIYVGWCNNKSRYVIFATS